MDRKSPWTTSCVASCELVPNSVLQKLESQKSANIRSASFRSLIWEYSSLRNISQIAYRTITALPICQVGWEALAIHVPSRAQLLDQRVGPRHVRVLEHLLRKCITSISSSFTLIDDIFDSFIGFQRWTFIWQYCHFPRPTESIPWWSLSKALQEEAAEDEEKVGEPNGYSLPQLHGCQESVRCSISLTGGPSQNWQNNNSPKGKVSKYGGSRNFKYYII